MNRVEGKETNRVMMKETNRVMMKETNRVTMKEMNKVSMKEMNRQEIEKLLQNEKITSTSELILFIVEQVKRISNQKVLQQVMKISQIQQLRLREMENKVWRLEDVQSRVLRLEQMESRIWRLQEMQNRVLRLEQKESNLDESKLGSGDQSVKGLDEIMLEEVKTIVEAMLQQKQTSLLSQIQTQIQHLKHYINTQIQSILTHENPIPNLLSPSPSLNQYTSLTPLPLISTNNYPNIHINQQYDQINKQNCYPFNKFKINKQKINHELKDDVMDKSIVKNQFSLLKEKVNKISRQIQDMKISLIQIKSSISFKLNIHQTQQLISQFQSRIYRNIHQNLSQTKKIQSTSKKLFSQILTLKDQYKEYVALKEQNSEYKRKDKQIQKLQEERQYQQKSLNKLQQKLNKTKTSIKQLTSNQHTILSELQNKLNKQKRQIQDLNQLNNLQNNNYQSLLIQINQILPSYHKITSIQTQINLIQDNIISLNAKMSCALFQTSFQTKNQHFIWKHQIYNSSPQFYKFQSNKSQIVLNQKGLYQAQFIILQNKNFHHLTASLSIISYNLNSTQKITNLFNSNRKLQFFFQIQQKSSLKLKIPQLNGSTSQEIKGLLKICLI